eukprot:PITA_02900
MASHPLFLFENPSSLYIQVVAVVLLLQGIMVGLMEFKGINLKYSKFANSNPGSSSTQIPSKLGMFVAYVPAFLICILVLFSKLDWPNASTALHKLGLLQLSTSLNLQKEVESRFLILVTALAIHFLKRVMEVLFIHRYSGGMTIDIFVFLPLGYIFTVGNLLYDMQLSEEYLGRPSVNLIPLGIFLFIVGITGNFYHHYLLSKLRKDGDKLYSIPQGGLFRYVVCPHFFFEVIEFLGVALICQTPLAFCVVVMMFFALLGRSISTKSWYMQKFEDFPSHRKALIPFLM